MKISSRIYVPTADTVDNVTVRDVVGNKTDTVAGDSLVGIAKSIYENIGPSSSHHEHVWPKSNGIGGAGVPLTVTTDSQDEDNAAQSDQDYWGEPTTFDPSEAGEWKLTALFVEAETANKTFQYQLFTTTSTLCSAKNGGNAWDKTATVLTVVDGSLFLANDFVAIISDYKTEIQKVASVDGNAVTIVREAAAVGIAGLRWNHTTNDPGTETMCRVGRNDVSANHPMGGLFSAASSKESRRITFHTPRLIAANGIVLIRALNQTDSLNAADFRVAIIYED